MGARDEFTEQQLLAGCFRAGWYCEVSGLPLVFPPALLTLERLVSCTGPTADHSFGYYDFRQTRWNAPLNSLCMPVADHRVPAAQGGKAELENLQVLAGLVNETKSDRELKVISPFALQERADNEALLHAGSHALYWPPSPKFWDDPSRPQTTQAYEGADPAQKKANARIKDKKNPRSRRWDGMVGVFLRLYRPDAPEFVTDWNPRNDGGRNDRTFLARWYRQVFKFAENNPEYFERYAHLEASDQCWWRSPLT